MVVFQIMEAAKFWAVLLLMAPIAYILSNRLYEAGDGWIKIIGQEGFSKKVIAVIGLAIGLPLMTVFGSQIQDILYNHLPTGMWLLPYIGIGMLGVLWMVNDAANMNMRDGQRSTRLLIVASLFLIVIPFIIQHITSTYDLGLLWQETVVQPIVDGIITPIKKNSGLILLGGAVCLYAYFRYQRD
jgi:hypothetical protein